jgi:spore germination protein KC
MKKKFMLLLILLMLFFVSGCWDYVEYENIAQIVGIGVDFNKKTQETTITQQILVPVNSRGSQGAGPPSSKTGMIYSATDKTDYEALPKLQQVMMKRLFYGYLRTLILGEECAKYNFPNQNELLDRTPPIRETAYMLMCSGKAEKVLSTVEENSATPSSQFISSLVNNSKATGAAFPVTLHDASELLAISGWEVTIPRVISSAPEKTKLIAGGNADGVRIDEKYKGGFRISGMGAFKGNKFVGWLNEKETRGFGFITGKKMTAYKVSSKPAGTDPADILYFRLNKSGGKIKAKLVNDEPTISVDVSVTAELRKYYSGKGSDFLSPEENKMAEQVLANSIRSDIKAALTRGQSELKSDIFGFGFAFFRKNPGLWKSQYEKIWPDIYPDLPVQVTVKTKVINTGTNIRKFTIK